MTSQATVRSRHQRSYALAKQMADAGFGWEDIVAKCGLTQREAKLIVFGKKP